MRGETPLHRGDKDKSNRKKLVGRLGLTSEEGYERPAVQTGPQCHLCVSRLRIDIDIDNIHLAEREWSGYKKWRRNSEERGDYSPAGQQIVIGRVLKHVILCHVMSCYVMLCQMMSRDVMSCHYLRRLL